MSTSANPTETSPHKPNHKASFDNHSAFICTICWQRQPRSSKPKLLGTSARIVCRACWRSVLDLSICWVCGECIVRGDEVVSLGWCFWHRGCFGCLVCGTRLDVPATVAGSICGENERRGIDEKGEWGKWDGSEDGAGVAQSARCIGVELEEIPMCTVCEVETAGESTDRVLERGLETVTRSDGGLSRSRIDMLSESKGLARTDMHSAHQSSTRNSNKTKGKSRTEESLRNCSLCLSDCHVRKKSLAESRTDKEQPREPLNSEHMSPLLDNAAHMSISEDGSIDDFYSQNDTEMCDLQHAGASPVQDPAANVIYISVTNPVGEPAFRPSKTKPLPKWMNLLPSNVHREREEEAKTAAEITKHSHGMEQMRGVTASYTSDGSDDFDSGTPIPDSGAVSPKTDSERQTATSITEFPQKLQVRATIAFHPIPRGDTAEESVYETKQRSQTTYSACLSTQKCPCSHPSRPQTTYPRSPYPSRPSIARNETTSYFSPRLSIATAADSMNEPCRSPVSPTGSPDSSNTISPMKDYPAAPETVIDFSSPSQSSEYLERYQPKKIAEAKYEKYVACEAEPILEKIKRQKAGIRDIAESSKEKVSNKGKGKMFLDEEFGLDPRREDLNKELRNLFCEE